MEKRLKKAFTLAEVLITLMIIGIVAAITIPTLMNNIGDRQNATAMKKKYAEMVEMIKRAELAADERADQWDWSLDTDKFVEKYLLTSFKGNKCQECWVTPTANAIRGFWFEQPAYAAPPRERQDFSEDELIHCFSDGRMGANVSNPCYYMCDKYKASCSTNGDLEQSYNHTNVDYITCYLTGNYTQICQNYLAGMYDDQPVPNDNPELEATYGVSDGSTIGFYKVNNKQILYIYVDVNGAKSPNAYGKDRYLMLLAGRTLSFYGEGEADLTTGTYGCSDEGNKMYCGALLKENDWNK